MESPDTELAYLQSRSFTSWNFGHIIKLRESLESLIRPLDIITSLLSSQTLTDCHLTVVNMAQFQLFGEVWLPWNIKKITLVLSSKCTFSHFKLLPRLLCSIVSEIWVEFCFFTWLSVAALSVCFVHQINWWNSLTKGWTGEISCFSCLTKLELLIFSTCNFIVGSLYVRLYIINA